MKILIADDDPVSLRVLRQILTTAGHEVDEAECGAEAWVLLQMPGNAYDAAVLDISMPGCDGLEILQRTREMPTLRNLPVVICTSSSDRATVLRAVGAGVRHYIVKPAQSEMVLTKLLQAVNAASDTPAGETAKR